MLHGTVDHRLGLLWALLATTGLRSGEGIGLRWQDIHLARGQLTISQSPERRTGQGIVFKEPKTGWDRYRHHLMRSFRIIKSAGVPTAGEVPSA